jgi:hypothetical protein
MWLAGCVAAPLASTTCLNSSLHSDTVCERTFTTALLSPVAILTTSSYRLRCTSNPLHGLAPAQARCEESHL